jgi:four helix bundle protein
MEPFIGIAERSFKYSLDIIKLFQCLEKTGGAARKIGNQLFDAGTSVGANVHEAQGGQSKRDFIAKMSIAHKEILEAEYWLNLVAESGIMTKIQLEAIINETGVIRKIISSILLSSKGKRKPTK